MREYKASNQNFGNPRKSDSYAQRIELALKTLNDRRGSRFQDISKFIAANYKVDMTSKKKRTYLKIALAKLVTAEILEKHAGGRYKLCLKHRSSVRIFGGKIKAEPGTGKQKKISERKQKLLNLAIRLNSVWPKLWERAKLVLAPEAGNLVNAQLDRFNVVIDRMGLI